jgi:hypothetical protein
MSDRTATLGDIPSGLRPHFQEYDPRTLDLDRDANLIMQRTLEYGTWDEVRWLFGTYGGRASAPSCESGANACCHESPSTIGASC